MLSYIYKSIVSKYFHLALTHLVFTGNHDEANTNIIQLKYGKKNKEKSQG